MEQKDLPLETIYVSIPSLYDEELVATITDAFDKAENPERVFIGIALQDSDRKLLKVVKEAIKPFGKRVNLTFTKLTKRNAAIELGVGKGRAKAHSFYDDEDYFLQIDSHTMFSSGWDSRLITMLAEAKAASQNKKTILTAYAGNYFLTEEGERVLDFPQGLNEHYGFYYPLYSRFETRMGIPTWDTVPLSKISDTEAPFVPAPKFNANFAFGDKDFARALGLELNVVFFEEEIVQSINILGAGYSMAFPNSEEAVVRHYYLPPNMTGPVNRKSAGNYMEKFDVFEEMNSRQRTNYAQFLDTECKADSIRAYQDYANIDLRHGRRTESMLHPVSWVLETFNYEEIISAFNAPEAQELPVLDPAEPSEEGCGCKKDHDHAEEAPTEKPKEARPWDMLDPRIGRVSEEIKKMRMDACTNCEFFVKLTKQCTKCGCHMPWKTGLPHASCPVGKWEAVADEGN